MLARQTTMIGTSLAVATATVTGLATATALAAPAIAGGAARPAAASLAVVNQELVNQAHGLCLDAVSRMTVLAAYLYGHRTMINGSVLCAG